MENFKNKTYEFVELEIEFIKIEKGFAQTDTESGTTGDGFSDGGVF